MEIQPLPCHRFCVDSLIQEITQKFAWSALLSGSATTCASVRRQQLASMAVEYCTNKQPELFAGTHYSAKPNAAKVHEGDTTLAVPGQLKVIAALPESDLPAGDGLTKDGRLGLGARSILPPDGAPENITLRDITEEFRTVLDAKLQPVFDAFNTKLQDEAEGLRWPPETEEPGAAHGAHLSLS